MTRFSTAASASIPIFLPHETHLIIAKASTRLGDVPSAISALNEVLTDTDDIYDINAG